MSYEAVNSAGRVASTICGDRLKVSTGEMARAFNHKIRLNGLWKRVGREFYRVEDKDTVAKFCANIERAAKVQVRFVCDALFKLYKHEKIKVSKNFFDCVMSLDFSTRSQELAIEIVTRRKQLNRVFGAAKSCVGREKYLNELRLERERISAASKEAAARNDEIMPNRAAERKKDGILQKGGRTI